MLIYFLRITEAGPFSVYHQMPSSCRWSDSVKILEIHCWVSVK